MNASINSLSLSDLPAALEALARAAIGRSKIVRGISVSFTTGPASVSFGWRASEAFTYGKLIGRGTHHWTGSDGEGNVTVCDSYSAPVATATKARTTGVFVDIVVGNLTEQQVQMMSDAIYGTIEFDRKRRDVLGLLPVIVDASFAQQPEVAEMVETVESWDSICVGGTAGQKPAAMVARDSVTDVARVVTGTASPKRKSAARVIAPTLDANVEAMLAAGWLS